MQKILMIDDEMEMLDVLSGFFSQRGYAAITALNTEEGLRQFDKEKPDLVLCDIKMPGRDGFEFLKEVRASRRWVPIIIISALTDPANILKGYGLQADFYLTKPLDLNEALKSVELMLSLAPLRKDK